jgi:hypothetical protein
MVKEKLPASSSPEELLRLEETRPNYRSHTHCHHSAEMGNKIRKISTTHLFLLSLKQNMHLHVNIQASMEGPKIIHDQFCPWNMPDGKMIVERSICQAYYEEDTIKYGLVLYAW